MSSSSRIPLAARQPLSTNRERELTRVTANKIKRKSISQPNPTAVKRVRTVSRPPTPPFGASTAGTAATSSSLARPLSQSMATGRATIASSSVRPSGSALRPPASILRGTSSSLRTPLTTIRQRTSALSSAAPPVDTEKENMRAELEELRMRLEEKDGMLEEKKDQLRDKSDKLEDKGKKLEEARDRLEKTRDQLEEKKSEVYEAKETIKELTRDLQTEREEHEQTRIKRDELVARLKKEAIEKDDSLRTLHNDVVDLRGRIRVSARVRPLLKAESEESTEHLSYPDETTVGIEQQKGKMLSFDFNHVYGPNYSQQRIFDSVKDLILSVMHGYNVSIISYGQTGSGKTHTMRGGEEDAAGLIPRAVRFLFENRSRLEDLDWSFEFAASFLEVYNDECYDLLSTPPRAKRVIKQVNNKFVVEGSTVEPIDNVHKMSTLLRKSDANRSTAATKCNETSSRSHAIFALSVKGVNGTTGAKIDCVLKLVDLAGSERAKETGATGDRFTEMTHINTALSNLQTCIRSILTKQSHVPYRNSKLTMMLQDSLAGGSKCMVILSLSPQLSTINETKRTLEFGRNLSQTHIGAAKKRET